MGVGLHDIVFAVVTTVGPLILAIAVHEWAHIAMARWLGDNTGTAQGRFTLNPLAHIDPLWTVGIPTFFVVSATLGGAVGAVPFFGAGKPAPYNPARLTRSFGGRRVSLRVAELLVAAAGPLSNLVLAVVTCAVVVVLLRSGSRLDDPQSVVMLAFRFVVLNVGLCVFNLVPIPPLDGSKIIFGVLPYSLAQRYAALTERLSWLLLIAVFLGGNVVLAPIQNGIIVALFSVVAAAAG
jgi:Zn-dependent protease